MKTPGQRLKHARQQAGYRTAKEFADKHGIPQPTYAMHESGKRTLLPEVAERYAALLGNTSTGWLLSGERPAAPATDPMIQTVAELRRVAGSLAAGGDAARFRALIDTLDEAITIGHITAGERSAGPGLAEEEVRYEGPTDDAASLLQALYPGQPQAYWLRANTNAMNLAGILPGDYLVVDPTVTPRLGQPVVAQVVDNTGGTAATILRAFQPGILVPRSTTPAYKPQAIVDDPETVTVGIAGAVARVYRASP